MIKYFLILCSFPLYNISFCQQKENNQNTFTDPRDKQVYHTVRIGNMIWFKENLKYLTPKSDCYDDVSSNCEKYGRLYTLNDALSVCPGGWRIPTVKDWKKLKKIMGEKSPAKIIEPKEWLTEYAKDATNELGLSVLPAGRKDDKTSPSVTDMDGNLYSQLDTTATFWINDKTSKNPTHWHVFESGGKKHKPISTIHKHGSPPEGVKFSVRCVCEAH